MVGGEVGDGHVGLVADARHHRHGAGADRPRHGLVVEGHQVLERPTAAHQQHHLHAARATGAAQRGDDGLRSALPLHGRRGEDDVDAGSAASEDGDDVVQRRAGARRHHRDARGQERERALVSLVEHALGGQRAFALLHSERERADPARLEAIDHQLVAALLRVHGDLAVRDNRHAVLGREGHAQRVGAEAHAAERARAVLQRHVDVPGRRPGEVADLALDEHVLQLRPRRQRVADQGGQLGDGERGRVAHTRSRAIWPSTPLTYWTASSPA